MQSLFRSVNERAVRMRRDDGWPTLGVACECGSTDCSNAIELPMAVYEQVRRQRLRFLVVRGHEIPAAEDVVSAYGDFLVVEKTHAAAKDELLRLEETGPH